MNIEKANYKTTDWIYFFNKENKFNVSKIDNPECKPIKEELVTWKLVVIFLPIVTFMAVAILNILTNICNYDSFLSYLNNGTIPIISFGIITSGMPYLLEQLEEFPEYHTIRRRVMAISLIFLFLSASLYIIQTLSIISTLINHFTNFIILIVSIFVFLCSKSIGVKMFILQSKYIPNYDSVVEEKVKNLKEAVGDLD